MKVLFVCSLYYPHVGGIETLIAELAQRYRKEGIDSAVLTKQWPSDLPSYEVYQDTPIFRTISAKADQEFDQLAIWLKAHASTLRADIIHVIGIRRPLPLAALLLSRLWQVPLLVTIGGGDIPDSDDAEPTFIWNTGKHIVRPVLDQADSVTAFSQAFVKKTQLLSSTLEVSLLYAGMNREPYDILKPKRLTYPYIFAFRRLHPSKGIDLLIDAYARIASSYPKLRLIIAGDGTERSFLEQRAYAHKLGDCIQFIGTIPLSEGISYLKGAVMTVVPSRSEAGGLVNIEAQAAGCPVVASNVGGIPEYVGEGETGLLFPSGNVESLAQQMRRILDNPSLRRQLIKNGKQHAAQFDWNYLAPQYIAHYEKLIKSYQPRSLEIWSPLIARMWEKLVYKEMYECTY